MKYRIVDADNRAEYSKPKTFEEVKAWFEPIKMNLALNWMHEKLNIVFKSRLKTALFYCNFWEIRTMQQLCRAFLFLSH